MRSFVKNSLGVDTPVPADADSVVKTPVSARTSPSSPQRVLSVMALSALPWVPVAAGAWIGDKYDKKGWGALAGFAFSFLTLCYVDKQMTGNIK